MNLLKQEPKYSRYRFVSAGSLMRERAESLGFATIEEFVEHAGLHPEEEHDLWCDSAIATCGERDRLICESRLSHIFMPHAFKVKLTCGPFIRARRRIKSRGLNMYRTLQGIVDRDASDWERYEALYPGCRWSNEDYDLVIDTGLCTRQGMLDIVVRSHEVWKKALPKRKIISSTSVRGDHTGIVRQSLAA